MRDANPDANADVNAADARFSVGSVRNVGSRGAVSSVRSVHTSAVNARMTLVETLTGLWRGQRSHECLR